MTTTVKTDVPRARIGFFEQWQARFRDPDLSLDESLGLLHSGAAFLSRYDECKADALYFYLGVLNSGMQSKSQRYKVWHPQEQSLAKSQLVRCFFGEVENTHKFWRSVDNGTMVLDRLMDFLCEKRPRHPDEGKGKGDDWGFEFVEEDLKQSESHKDHIITRFFKVMLGISLEHFNPPCVSNNLNVYLTHDEYKDYRERLLRVAFIRAPWALLGYRLNDETSERIALMLPGLDKREEYLRQERGAFSADAKLPSPALVTQRELVTILLARKDGKLEKPTFRYQVCF